MFCRYPRWMWLVAILIAFAFFHSSRSAHAQWSGIHRHHSVNHDATYLFRNVTIGPGEVINGDLNVIFGNAVVQGVVNGDLNVIGGSCDYSSGTVNGEVNCVQTASVSALAPWAGSYFDGMPFVEQTNRLSITLAANLIVLFMFLLFPVRVRVALARVEAHPGLCGVAGVLGFVAVFPLALLLILSIVGIPLVLLEFAAVFAGVWVGQGAIAVLVGRRLSELIRPNTTPSPLAALILGLVVVSAAEILPVVGWAVIALMIVVGLGATILAFIPFTPPIPIATPAGNGGGRNTIAGPPMTSR